MFSSHLGIACKGERQIKISDFKTDEKFGLDKEQTKADLENVKSSLENLQSKFYAEARNSILIVFQAMDAAGKDGTIRTVMTGINPQGCRVVPFKAPSSLELRHDFLWRSYKELPEKGLMTIFNRSHYEEVLITRVHPEFIVKQQLPGIHKTSDIDSKFWDRRFDSIRYFETHLAMNGTLVLKFFLHVSKEEQRKRFLERIDNEHKNWKFSMADVEERQLWDSYMSAYEEMIEKTASKHAPWYIIPSDNNWVRNYLVARIIQEELEKLNPQFPVLDGNTKDLLKTARAILEIEK